MITAMPRIAIAVNDFESALTTFRDHFGMPVADFSPETVPSLGAHVAMCQPPGGSNIELMARANPKAPLSQALQKFLDHRGEGISALLLEAPDPAAKAAADLPDELRQLADLPLAADAGGIDAASSPAAIVDAVAAPAPAPNARCSADPHASGSIGAGPEPRASELIGAGQAVQGNRGQIAGIAGR